MPLSKQDIQDIAHAVWAYNQGGKKRSAWAMIQTIADDVWGQVAKSVDGKFSTTMRRFITGNNDWAARTGHAVARVEAQADPGKLAAAVVAALPPAAKGGLKAEDIEAAVRKALDGVRLEAN